MNLHWLPVKLCCGYKVAMFAVLFGQYTPILTFSLVCTYQTLHILQSSGKKLLKISKHNLKSFGEHLFPLSFFCGWWHEKQKDFFLEGGGGMCCLKNGVMCEHTKEIFLFREGQKSTVLTYESYISWLAAATLYLFLCCVWCIYLPTKGCFQWWWQ